MKKDTVLSNGTELTSYLATAYAEGFCEGEGASDKDQLKAWAYLIKTGACQDLQGWFGRTAEIIIKGGMINEEGEINWEVANDKITAWYETEED